jgi:dTDP-4-dehydrorhamnose reductase
MLRLGRERDELRVVDDQFGAPTAARLIAEVTAACIGRLATGSPPASGVYHLAPHGETTWCRFARAILAAARERGVPLRCPPENVVGIGTADYPLPARRPAREPIGGVGRGGQAQDHGQAAARFRIERDLRVDG